MCVHCMFFFNSSAGFLRWFWLDIQVDVMQVDVEIVRLIHGRVPKKKPLNLW